MDFQLYSYKFASAQAILMSRSIPKNLLEKEPPWVYGKFQHLNCKSMTKTNGNVCNCKTNNQWE